MTGAAKDKIGVYAVLMGALGVIRGRWEAFALLVALGALLGVLVTMPFTDDFIALRDAANARDEAALKDVFSSLIPGLGYAMFGKTAVFLMLSVLWIRFVRLGGGSEVMSGLATALWRSLVLLIGVALVCFIIFLGALLITALLAVVDMSEQGRLAIVFLVLIAAFIPLELGVARGFASTALGRPMSVIEAFERLRGARSALVLFLVLSMFVRLLVASLIGLVFASVAGSSLAASIIGEALNQAIWLLLLSGAIPLAARDERRYPGPASD